MIDRPSALVPSDPYRWHESVLSTRSLSYMSTVSAFGIPSPMNDSRNASISHMYSRPPSTIDDQSEYDLELTLRSQKETLPPSVAGSLLFALPQEIRDRIYTFCLASLPLPAVEWPGPEGTKLGLAPQLLRTCKIIFAEAAPILYANNAFSFAHPSDANIFVRAITARPCSELISRVNLHVKAADTRLWMAWLSSTNAKRSIKYDLPSLKDLTVRYKSNKWQHAAPVDVNLRHWAEDRHLEEIIDGLRQTYFPSATPVEPLGEEAGDIYDEYSREPGPPEHHDGLYMPIVKVIGMCRVHTTQFHALTGPPDQHEPPFQGAVFIPQVIQHAIGMAATPQPAGPTQDGEAFRGFTAGDLAGRGRKVYEVTGMHNAPALVARTVFANKRSILLALEVFAYEQVAT